MLSQRVQMARLKRDRPALVRLGRAGARIKAERREEQRQADSEAEQSRLSWHLECSKKMSKQAREDVCPVDD